MIAELTHLPITFLSHFIVKREREREREITE